MTDTKPLTLPLYLLDKGSVIDLRHVTGVHPTDAGFNIDFVGVPTEDGCAIFADSGPALLAAWQEVASWSVPESVRIAALGRERDDLRAEAADIASILTDAGIPTEHDDSELTLPARVQMLVTRRANERRDLVQVRELLDDHNIAGDIPAAVAMLLQERAEWRARTPPAPDVAPGGVEWRDSRLYIDGEYAGLAAHVRESGLWSAVLKGVPVYNIPNEPTARAVLLALAGQECGRVVFGLREDAPVGALIAAVIAGLGSFVTDPVAGGTTWTKDPATVRAWVEHGQAALTIEAVAGV